MIRALAISLLFACVPAPRGPWIVEGAAWEAQSRADAAIRVTGDRKGYLAAGGTVRALPDLDAICPHREGWHASGCVRDAVYVLSGLPVEETALSHEFCHLGLLHGGGYSGPVVGATEAQADACALLVEQEVTP